MTIHPFILAAALAATPALAQKPEVFTDAGAAIRGYDPVAYFTEAKPVTGDALHAHQWNGATWRFSNKQNRDAFAAAPEKYAPQYGGYCAYGVAVHGAGSLERARGQALSQPQHRREAEVARGPGGLHPQGGHQLAEGAGALGRTRRASTACPPVRYSTMTSETRC